MRFREAQCGIYHQASLLSNLLALIVHRRDGLIPLLHALSVICEIKARDCDFPRDYGVNGCATVANHE